MINKFIDGRTDLVFDLLEQGYNGKVRKVPKVQLHKVIKILGWKDFRENSILKTNLPKYQVYPKTRVFLYRYSTININ